MEQWGKLIDFKFAKDGRPLVYRGNTVITDLEKGNPSFPMILHLKTELEKLDLAKNFIILPEDSYHLTVMRGLNDKVRTREYWPENLSLDATMKEVDEYVAGCVETVPYLGPLEMQFSHVQVNDEDVRVIIKPYDLAQEQKLKEYRDRLADSLGLRLPGHDQYKYHITLAYVRFLAQAEEEKRIERYCEEMDHYLQTQVRLVLPPPYMAYYQDMFSYSAKPFTKSVS